MSKIKIKVIIKNNVDNINYHTTAIVEENIIKYIEEDRTITKYDIVKNRLIRENSNMKMDYFFDESKMTQGIILLKDINKKVTINIITNKIERKEKDIKIEYTIDDNYFLYRIEEIK